jgi:hypothetical protein
MEFFKEHKWERDSVHVFKRKVTQTDIKLDSERWTLWEVGICPKREFEFSKTVNTKASPGRSEE